MKELEKRRKSLSLIIALLMVFSCVPSMAFAEEAINDTGEEGMNVVEGINEETAEAEDTEAEVSIVDSGTCGENLTWELDSEGTLTISGTGEMENNSGWYSYRKDITSLKIEEGVSSICYNAFIGASNIKGPLIIPDSVEDIGYSAFSGCSGFTGDLVIPDSVETIGYSAFSGCSGFTGDLVIPDSVKTIGSTAFENCSGFDGTLTLPMGITALLDGTFYNCRGLSGDLIIPSSVKKIGSEAFYNCQGFTGDLIIPNKVKTIGEYAFFGCSGFGGTLSLPDSIISIQNRTFSGCSGLTGDLVIPDSVKTIGNHAFVACSSFDGTLTLPNELTTIGDSAFYNCSGFTGNLVIPDSVETIGAAAFSNCSGMAGSLTISDSVKTIGSEAFKGCHSFTGDLIISDSVETIGAAAFYNCSGFTGSLILPTKLVNITEYTFFKCNFENIYIPDSVTYISQSCFNRIAIESPRTFHIFKDSYADQYLSMYKESNDAINYISEESQRQKDYLAFKTSTIVVGATESSDAVDLASLLVSNSEVTLNDNSVIISDTDIAMYSNGYVLGIYEGECDITVIVGNQECSAKLIVINDEIPITSSFEFAEESIIIDRGTTAYNQIVKNQEGTNLTIDKWSSADKDVATVDEIGVVTAVGPGITTITAKSGDLTVSYNVEVVSIYIGIYILYPTDKYDMIKGEKESLRYYIYPFDATDDNKVTFESSNKDIVTVTEEGVIEAVGIGTATIKVKKGNINDSVSITVNNPIKAISLDKSSLRANVQDEIQLNLNYDPIDHNDDATPSWISSDESIATVDKNGLVTIKGSGVATITATVKGFTASCKVTALPMVALESITLDAEMKTIKCNEQFTFTVTKTPQNTTNKKAVLWESSNEDIVIVSEDGTAKGVSVGTASITATVNDTKNAIDEPITATCEITVEKAIPEYTIPEGLNAIVGETLADIKLPKGFTWNDETAEVGDRGDKTFKATYTPEDTDNYEIIDDIYIPLNVLDPKVVAISIKETLELCVDSDFTLEATIETQDDPEYTVIWSVENSDIVEVDQNGKLIAKATGETTVIVKTLDEMTASCKVIVNEHDYDVVITKPTCTEKGYTTYTCKNDAKHTYVGDYISANGHTEAIEDAVAATCTQTGLTVGKNCSACGEILVPQEEVPVLAHSFGDWKETKESTCIETGEETRECACGEKETRGVEATGHNYEAVVTVPTCTEGGYTTYTCACGDSYVADEVAATGHSYCEWITDSEATCIAEGNKHKECACGDKVTETITKLEHAYDSVVTEPTCKEAGYTTHTCGRCGDSYIDTEVAATGHKNSVVKVTAKATTSKNGLRSVKCQVCGTASTETIYKVGAVTLSAVEYTYDGKKKAPAVTVKDSNGNVIDKANYTVSYASGRTKVGKYKVTVTLKGDYSGTKTAYFTIVPKAPSSASATLYGYDDVKFSWKKATGASGYYVYYKKSTASKYTYLTSTTGTYVKKKNLSDGVQYNFKVVPYYKSGSTKYASLAYKTASVYTLKKVATPVVAKSGSKVKVSWTNIAGETGYQISQSTKKSGTKIVSTYKTTKGTYKTIKAKKGKKYYYKVRAYKTVGGKKIYGPWSTVKSYKR